MDKNFVYMDFNATCPLRPEVKDFLVSHMDVYANASSMHEAGREAAKLMESSREEVARLIGAKPSELVFTSGGSESNNMVFQTMLLEASKRNRRSIVISAIEHPCVINAAEELGRRGLSVVTIPVDETGRVDLEAYRAAMGSDTLLVSIMMANNEIGTVQDINLLASLAHEAGALFHSDAVQAVGKIPVDVEVLGVDYLTLSAHKIYGPKGIGALWHRHKTPLEPLIRGGHQERGLRAGTYNTTAIYGFGLAARLAGEELSTYQEKLFGLRARLRQGLVERVPNIRINGNDEHSIPNTLNVSFPGAEGEAILLSLDLSGIAASTGSACASGSLDPSHVLMATGVGPELAHGSIRFSMGRTTTASEVDRVLELVPPIIERLRAMSTLS